MRIQIDNHTNHGRHPDGSHAWIVSPGNGEQINASPIHYNLVIEHDASPDPDRIIRECFVNAERYQVLSQDEFDELVQLHIDHDPEDLSTRQVHELLEARNQITARTLELAFSGSFKVFEDLETAWRAINQFVDFGVTR